MSSTISKAETSSFCQRLEWIQEKALSMMPDYMVEDYEDFKAMYIDKEKTL